MAELERRASYEHIKESSVLEDVELIQKAFDLILGVQLMSVSEFESIIKREGEKVFIAPEGPNSHNVFINRRENPGNRTEVRLTSIKDTASGENVFKTAFYYNNGNLERVISSTETNIPKVDPESDNTPNRIFTHKLHLLLRENSPVVYEKTGSSEHRGTLE